MFKKLANLFKRNIDLTPGRLEADKGFYISIALLVAFGLVMLASASAIVAYNSYQDTYHFFKRQLLSVAIGAFAFWFFSRIDYRRLRLFALPSLILSIILLLLVFIPGLGREVNGSQSWINLFGFSLQPAELVKFSFIAYLAALFDNSAETPKRFWLFFILYGVIALLMLLQPDLGTLFILTFAAFAVYYVGGGKLKHILGFFAVSAIALSILVSLPGQQYKLNRFRCFVDFERDRQGACYQINQSLIAVGSGGAFGRGLGESRQKFLYLPEVQNDFIFAIIAEETGLIGGATIILLFAFLCYRGWGIARRAPDTFGRNLTVGITTWVVIQAILNIGGITNFLPMTGVPLPLISYGGTAIIATLAGLGVVASVSRYRR